MFLFQLFRALTCAVISHYITLHGHVRLSSWIPMRSSPRINFPSSEDTYTHPSSRICIAPVVLSFFLSFSLPFSSPNGTSGVFILLLETFAFNVLPRLSVISHRSFVLFHASGISAVHYGIYLPLAKTRAIPLIVFLAICVLCPFSSSREFRRSRRLSSIGSPHGWLLSLASFRFASSSRSCESRHEVSLKSNLVSVFSLKISLSTRTLSLHRPPRLSMIAPLFTRIP